MDLGLRGRKALVTAASQGIGNFIANTLAAEGADVAICARTPDKVAGAVDELKKHGTNVIGAPCDVGDPEALKAWVEQSAKDLGGIDVYVSNASAGGGPDWDAHYAIDMMGTVNGVEAALPSLTESDAASVIIVSTSAAVRGVPASADDLRGRLRRDESGAAELLELRGPTACCRRHTLQRRLPRPDLLRGQPLGGHRGANAAILRGSGERLPAA